MWAPVKEFHDRNAAEVELANAKMQQPTPVPASTLAALAEAVKTETPQLNDTEALRRSDTMIADAVDQRGAHHARALQSAHDTMSTIDRERAARTRVRG